MLSAIREFGLDQCSLPIMVTNFSMMLRGLSLNLDPAYKKKIPIRFKIFTIFIVFCYIYVYVFSMSWFVLYKGIQTGDRVGIMIVLSLGMSSELSTVKFIYMFFYEDSLRNMVEKYLTHNSKAVSNSRFTKNLLKVLRRVKKRAMIFWIIVIGNGVVYAVKPLLMSGKHMMEDTEFIFGFQPLSESPNYEIAYFITVAANIFTCYSTANISAFFIIVTGYIEAQMISLSEELINIWEDAQVEYYQNNNIAVTSFGANKEEENKVKSLILNEYVKTQLRDIADNHKTNINFLSEIENVFRNAIVIEFGLLITSVIAEFLGGIENTYLLLPFALVQVTMDCISGQKLIDSSELFERAVYDSKWENFDVSNMKTVMIMLLNCKKNMAITAGGLVNLGSPCLMSVARMIYSTYTALKSAVNL